MLLLQLICAEVSLKTNVHLSSTRVECVAVCSYHSKEALIRRHIVNQG